MRQIKTVNAPMFIEISDLTPTTKRIIIEIDGGERKDIVLPADIVKAHFTDAAFIKHIINFFVKD